MSASMYEASRPDVRILAEIVRIGLPAALQQSLLSVLTVGLNRILMPFSQTAVGFYGVYYKLQNFLFMPVYGPTTRSSP